MAIVNGNIRCSTCEKAKPVADFQPSVVRVGCGVCRACKHAAKRDYERRNPEKARAAAKARRLARGDEWRAAKRDYYRRNPETYRRYNLDRYGITPEQYDALLAAQAGACACCGAEANGSGKRLFVDHDHATGAVRGILCHKCNVGIGALGDTADGVRRALAYLERAEAVRRPAPMRINLLKGERPCSSVARG